LPVVENPAEKPMTKTKLKNMPTKEVSHRTRRPIRSTLRAEACAV
jgi:hypothetical protein